MLELEPEVESLLVTRAKANGCDVNGYVRELIEKDMSYAQTFDEILAPVRKGFQESGLTEDEIIALFAEAREEVRQAQKAQESGNCQRYSG